MQRNRPEDVALAQLLERQRQRDEGAGDRRRPRAAVGLDDVAVDPDRPLAERREVGHRAQRPSDEPLNLLRPAADLALRASRCMRVLVARGSMPYSAVTQPLPVLRRNGGTRSSTLAVQMTLRVAGLDQHRAFRVHQVVRRHRGVAELVGEVVGRIASCSVYLYPREIFRERPAQVDVTRQRVDFLAVDEQLHRR